MSNQHPAIWKPHMWACMHDGYCIQSDKPTTWMLKQCITSAVSCQAPANLPAHMRLFTAANKHTCAAIHDIMSTVAIPLMILLADSCIWLGGVWCSGHPTRHCCQPCCHCHWLLPLAPHADITSNSCAQPNDPLHCQRCCHHCYRQCCCRLCLRLGHCQLP